MKRRMIVTSIVAVLLLLGLGLVVHAQGPEPAATGTLTAQGDGFLGLQARGTVEIDGQGSGVIWVQNGTVTAEGSGERFDLPKGGVLLVGWDGKVSVSGERLGLRMISHQVGLTATGVGLATLHGTGTYETESRSGDWSVTGTKVVFGLRNVIQGTGTLTASGAGEALVRGSGRVEIQSHGKGIIRIRGDARVTVDGQEPEQAQAAAGQRRARRLPGRPIVLRDVEGLVVAEGQQFEVAMRSDQIELTAEGTGVVGLRGQGAYEVGDQQGEWSESGLRIRIQPE